VSLVVVVDRLSYSRYKISTQVSIGLKRESRENRERARRCDRGPPSLDKPLIHDREGAMIGMIRKSEDLPWEDVCSIPADQGLSGTRLR
jgi:hypothetical protein